MGKILDGNKLAKEIKSLVKKDVVRLKARGIDTGLAIMLVGDDQASQQYFAATLRASKRVGIMVYEYTLSSQTSLNEILNLIHSINHDERINGLLVLLPLPKGINARRVVNTIIPEKDIDGLGAISVGRLAAEESLFQIFREAYDNVPNDRNFIPTFSSFLPCTPFGVIRLLDYYGVEIKGKNVVVVGKSLSVGKPLALMLLARNATVSVCHRETSDLALFLKNADIICSATGVNGLIKGNMIKDSAVVVDIGIKVLPNKEIVGDVDFDSVSEKASLVTPVPGGVGPVTIAMLLENTVRSAQRHDLINSPFTII